MRTIAQTKEFGKMTMGMYSLMKNDVYYIFYLNNCYMVKYAFKKLNI